MIAEKNGSTFTVTAASRDVTEFAASWPGHELDTDAEYVFEFSCANGDLVDVNALRDGRLERLREEEDGSAMSALSDDACRFGLAELGLDDAMAIRYGNPPAPR